MTNERESEGGKRERSGGLTVAVILLFGLPAIYLLALGPIEMLIERQAIQGSSLTVVQWIYWPVICLATISETFRTVLDVYCELWR
jgi:hypothetical protein